MTCPWCILPLTHCKLGLTPAPHNPLQEKQVHLWDGWMDVVCDTHQCRWGWRSWCLSQPGCWPSSHTLLHPFSACFLYPVCHPRSSYVWRHKIHNSVFPWNFSIIKKCTKELDWEEVKLLIQINWCHKTQTLARNSSFQSFQIHCHQLRKPFFWSIKILKL